MRIILDPRLAGPVLRAVEPSVRRRLKAALSALAKDPSGASANLDVKQLETEEQGQIMYRLRVGDWRIAFTLEKSTLVVLRIFRRGDGYGWMKDMA